MFHNLKIGRKLSVLTGFLLALLVAIGLLSLNGLRLTHSATETVYKDRVVPLKDLKAVSDLYAVAIVETIHKIRAGEISWSKGGKSIEEAHGRIGQAWAAFLQHRPGAEERLLIDEAKGRMETADRAVTRLHQIVQAMDQVGLIDFIERDLYPAVTPVTETLGKLTDLQLSIAEREFKGSQELYRNLLVITLAAIAAGFVIATLFAAFIIRGITRPLGRVMETIEELNRGNLEIRLRLSQQDEIGRVGNAIDAFADNMQDEIVTAFNRLAAGDFTFRASGVIREPLARANNALNHVMVQIQGAGEQIATGSAQVSGASQSLSRGATDQASSLEEITSALVELTAQTKLNAENAGEANHLARQVKEAAENGNLQMQTMVSAMAEINQAGESISRIIKTIDEIAFQTNLLALNAAVEAARAGQHGKGFAVVAEEVRNLAARSAKAAGETAELIEGTVRKTGRGTEIADQTASALDEIVAGVSKVTALVMEIAAASNEQAQGIGQVNLGLQQIDAVTQQNTSHAEESAAAAEELARQADALRQMLTRFKLTGGGAAGR